MASKSAQQEPEKAEVIEEALDVLDTALDRLKVLFEQYFLGIQKQPPTFIHTDVERKLRDLAQMQIRNTALRYRFATLQQKYGSYNSYWRRTLRQIENGTYHRNLSKIGRQAVQSGAAIPAEILAVMPKRMREQIRRDREAALAIARRRDGGLVPDEELLTLAPLADDDDDTGFVSEPSELRRSVLHGGLHVLEDSDEDFDIEAFFKSVQQEDEPGEDDTALVRQAPPIARSSRPGTPPPIATSSRPGTPSPIATSPRPGTPPPDAGPGTALPSNTSARPATPPPRAGTPPPIPTAVVPRSARPPATPPAGMRPGQPTPPAGLPPAPAGPGTGRVRSGGQTPLRPAPPVHGHYERAARPAAEAPTAPARIPVPPLPKIPVAPSQLTRPIPIAPGAAAAQASVDVETMAGPFPREAPSEVSDLPTAPTASSEPPVVKSVSRLPGKTRPPGGSAPPPARQGPPPGMTDADVNALYAKYVKAKEMVGENAGPGAYGKLLKTINDQAPKIMEQYKAKGVSFSVVVKDNQVIIRAKPKT